MDPGIIRKNIIQHSQGNTQPLSGICFINKMGLNEKTMEFKDIDITMILCFGL